MRKLCLPVVIWGFLLFTVSASSFAQSPCPYIANGAVLTAAQWNGCFQQKEDALGFTPLNQAGGVMTGKLTTVAPSSSGAGLSLTPGTAPISPNDGDIWSTPSGLFVQIDGATVGPLAGPGSGSFAATSPLSVSFLGGVVTYGLNDGGVTNGKLAASGSYTIKGNFTGSSASPTDATIGSLPNKASPAGTDLVLIQDQAAGGALKNASVTALQGSVVTSIGGNVGAFTLNSTSGITNATNDIKCQAGSSSQFGCVKTDNVTLQASAGTISQKATIASNSLAADVTLSSINVYFDGPSMAQGTSGTWSVSGSVLLNDSTVSGFNCKLWDGTTVISSTRTAVAANGYTQISLSGILASPAGNLRISCANFSDATSKMLFNGSGNSKDSYIFGHRIQ